MSDWTGLGATDLSVPPAGYGRHGTNPAACWPVDPEQHPNSRVRLAHVHVDGHGVADTAHPRLAGLMAWYELRRREQQMAGAA